MDMRLFSTKLGVIFIMSLNPKTIDTELVPWWFTADKNGMIGPEFHIPVL